MTAWNADAEIAHPVDFRLVQAGFITMFWRLSVLDDTLGMLRSLAYRVVEFEAGAWHSGTAMYDEMASQLGCPDYFGRNLDALNDCMSDVASGGYGWDVGADTGLVIVLRGFDAFAAGNRRIAQTMLDIIAVQARYAMLFGHRIICLVQSNDPRLDFEPVGAALVAWNDAEWLDSERGF